AAGAVVEEPGIRIDDIWPIFRFASLGMGGPVPYVQSDENLARVRAHPEKLSPPVAAALLDDTAPPVSADDAVAEVERIVGQVRSVLDRYDVICSPTMPLVAPRIPDGWDTPSPTEHMGTWYLSVINALKGTAASHPAGLVDGLPVGLHVAAGPGAERTVARVLGALPEPVALPRSS